MSTNVDTYSALRLVRLSPNHSVVVHIRGYKAPEESGERPCELVRVSPDMGPVPKVADLLGKVYPSFVALREEILTRMRDQGSSFNQLREG